MITNTTSSTTAATAVPKTVLEQNLDQMYMILMGLLIQLMQCGFAFLEAGAVGSKNTSNIVMKNALDACVAGVAYWILGFAFAFGHGNGFIGWNWFALEGHPDDDLSHLFLELVIAATCSTIVSGSVAGRCKMVAYLIYSFVITGFIYPVVTRWAWCSEGWAQRGLDYEFDGVTEQIGFYDFSGSGAVHLCGGTSAFIAAVILGPRIGRFDEGSKIPPGYGGHSVPYAGYGALILLIGFMAFNGGSVMSVSRPGDGPAMSLSIVNTMISAGCAAYASLFVRKLAFPSHKWSVFNTINGSVCGMVAICASCNVVRPWGALIIGVGSGMIYNVTAWLVTKAKIDDPADSIGIHFAGGLWGLIAYAFLKYDTGILFAWDQRSGLLLAWQLVGICAIILWTGILSILLFGIMKYTGVFRVSAEVEKIGSDMPEHAEAAYQLHLGSFTPDIAEKLTYLIENMPIPAGSTSTKDDKDHGKDREKDRGNSELADVKIMNNFQPVFIPSNESNLTQPRRRISVTTQQGNVNAGFQEGAEGTSL